MTVSRVDRLTVLRDKLAELIPDVDDRTAPALAREYRAVLAELDRLGVREVSSVDDLTARRTARITKTKGADKAAARNRGVRAGGDPAR